VVSLIDTPGYGENLNAVDSFDVITSHVEGPAVNSVSSHLWL